MKRHIWGRKAESWGALHNYARYGMYDFALPVIAMGILLGLARDEDNPRGGQGIHGHSAYEAAI